MGSRAGNREVEISTKVRVARRIQNKDIPHERPFGFRRT